MSVARFVVAIVVAVAVAPAAARADDVQDARRRFDEGKAALTTGRFAEARDHFRASLALAPKAASAFNLAVALRGTGEPVEAVTVFEVLLEGAYGELSNRQREEIDALLERTRAEVAVLTVRIAGAASAEVRIDGRRLATLQEGEARSQSVDPGPHVVSATAPMRALAERRIDLPRGGREEVVLELAPSSEALRARLVVEGEPDDIVRIVGVAEDAVMLDRTVRPGRYRVEASGPKGRRATDVELAPGETLRVRLEAEKSSAFASPWLWSGVAVVVIGAVVAGVVLSRDRIDDPVRDPTYDVISALRGPR